MSCDVQTYLDTNGVSSRESVYEWTLLAVPSVPQPSSNQSSLDHWCHWVGINGNIFDYPGVYITDAELIDTFTVNGHRIHKALEPDHH